MLYDVVSVAAPQLPLNIVAHGNSLTWGDTLGGGQSATRWPVVLADLRPQDVVTMVATPGRTTVQLTAELEDEIEPLYSPSHRNILIMWEGINAIALGATASEAYEQYQDYCEAVSSNWEVHVMSVIPADPQTNGALQAIIDPFNTLLRGDHSFADGLIDIADNEYFAEFGPPGYQTDRVHLTDEGYAFIATGVVDPYLEAV